ncbi:hypothetical protein EVAR_65799_1 [Eumeta japonica]|uniref:Uncharacterized protein n=1 Tax=Eumeta variegata TaxID=151549 RepID=A0A4C1ZNE8_EUMVA|nr:hypothetical protein EVAR_65799_1 [Eumeta japonica]
MKPCDVDNDVDNDNDIDKREPRNVGERTDIVYSMGKDITTEFAVKGGTRMGNVHWYMLLNKQRSRRETEKQSQRGGVGRDPGCRRVRCQSELEASGWRDKRSPYDIMSLFRS